MLFIDNIFGTGCIRNSMRSKV